jgi:hypothetical protein
MAPVTNVDALSGAELKALVVELLAKVAELERSLAAQRDEIARLKGLQGRPTIKPSGMDKHTSPIRRARTPSPGVGGRKRPGSPFMRIASYRPTFPPARASRVTRISLFRISCCAPCCAHPPRTLDHRGRTDRDGRDAS